MKRFHSLIRMSAHFSTRRRREGLMQGFPIATAARLRKLTQRQLIVAGGICSQQEVDELDVSHRCRSRMAVYTELLAI